MARCGYSRQNAAALSPDDVLQLLEPIAGKNRTEFERRHDTDFAYEIGDLGRFRANIFMDRKGRGAVFRVISEQDPDRRGSRSVAAHPAAVPLNKGLVLCHRANRLGQVDHPLRDDRLHQSHADGSHHHDRGPDRVCARKQEVPDQPARSTRIPHRSRTPCVRHFARIPTSSWSEKCATSRPSPLRSRPPKRATSSSDAPYDDGGVDRGPRDRSVRSDRQQIGRCCPNR